MESVMVAVENIKPYRANAKLHPQEQIDKIIRSVELTGFDQPIVTDKEYIIIKGHGRLIAAKQMGLKEVPVVVLDVPKDVADKARLIDNKASESGYDLELLLTEISRFEQDNILDTGYSHDEYKELLSHLEQDSLIPETDSDGLDEGEKGDDSGDERQTIVLKFVIPSDKKEAVLEFLGVESTKPKVLGDALIKLCENG